MRSAFLTVGSLGLLLASMACGPNLEGIRARWKKVHLPTSAEVLAKSERGCAQRDRWACLTAAREHQRRHEFRVRCARRVAAVKWVRAEARKPGSMYQLLHTDFPRCPQGDPHDAPAGRFFARACRLGAAPACVALGDRLRRRAAEPRKMPAEINCSVCPGGPHPTVALMPLMTAAALPHYRRACRLQGANGCLRLGKAYERGVGTEVRLSAAIAAYHRGCSAKVPAACARLALLYLRIPRFAGRRREAHKLLDRACYDSAGLACRMMVRIAPGHAELFLKKAIQWDRLDCRAGEAEACVRLSLDHDVQHWASHHFAVEACGRGHRASCDRLCAPKARAAFRPEMMLCGYR